MPRFIRSCTAAAFVAVSAMAAQAAGPATSGESKTPTKLSAAQCASLWTQADKNQQGYLTAIEAKPFVSDFKAANTSGNGKLSRAEFQTACSKGLVHSSSTMGASPGTTGKAPNSPGGAMPPKKY